MNSREVNEILEKVKEYNRVVAKLEKYLKTFNIKGGENVREKLDEILYKEFRCAPRTKAVDRIIKLLKEE